MKNSSSKQILVAVATVAALTISVASAQGPAPAGQAPPAGGAPAGRGGPGGGGGGRGGGIPNATPEQMTALVEMTTALAPLTTAATTARNELATVAFTDVKNTAAINAAVQKLSAAELALATARADAFAKLQAGPNKLSPEQVTAFINAGGAMQAGRGGGGGGRPGGPGGPGGPAGPGGPGGGGRGGGN